MTTIFSIATLLFSVVLSAQSIENFSIDSGGASSENGIHILYTIGEVNMYEYSVGNISLSEGFINSNVTSSTLGIEDEDILDQKIIVYPNPASEFIGIKSQIPILSIEVFDLLGRKIMTQISTPQFNINHLTPGTYLLHIFVDRGKLIKKMIIY